MANTRKMVILSLFIGQALVLHIFENYLSLPMLAPGIKLGLANIVTIIVIMEFGIKEALIVGILRSFLGSLLGGNILGFLFSILGTIFSILIMGIINKRYKHNFSIPVISIIGAITHNVAQIIVASILVAHFAVVIYLPVLLLSGSIVGYFTGRVSACISPYLKIHLATKSI